MNIATDPDGPTEAERFAELYDVEKHAVGNDGILVEDPYPDFARLREEAPVHEGKVSDLLGAPINPSMRPDVPHYSLFSFEACNTALRENETFSSAYYVGQGTKMFGRGILEMVGDEHRRYRALVQGAFTPSRASWWIDKWIAALVDEAVSGFEDRGRAELNSELCARIPIQTITGSFGLNRQEALDYRERMNGGAGGDDGGAAFGAALLQRVIDARRQQPEDDVITMLVESELDENGVRHLLTDEEILGFARLIVVAGSGTTWRQLGILLTVLLRQPELIDAMRDDRTLVRRAIEEVMRWECTDPIFRRLVTKDVELCGTKIPAGSVVEVNLGAANRDPERWDDPDRFDPSRPPKAHLGFAGGPHICLGMHVARAEMQVALNAVLDRLPGLRFDDAAAPTRIVGLEHRGPTRLDVVFS
ncbi:MAG: cytochrome P450 [Ilumatobacteraceae bacterium]